MTVRNSTKRWAGKLPPNTQITKDVLGNFHVGSACYEDKKASKHKDLTKAIKKYILNLKEN